MKVFKILQRALASVAVLAILASCNSGQTSVKEIVPSTEFAEYVKAYTGNFAKAGAPVRIEFVAAPKDLSTEGVFTISPAVKGEVVWSGETSLTFMPEEGAMQSGTTYTVSCDLAKLFSVSQENLKNFRFTFTTAPKTSFLEVGYVQMSGPSPKVASISGQMTFSEPVTTAQAEKMLKVSSPVGQPKVMIEGAGEKATTYGFEVDNISITDEMYDIQVAVEGFGETVKETCLIPSGKRFTVAAQRLVEGKDEYIEVMFSQPLATLSDYSGLFTVVGAGRQICEIKDNIARIYFERLGEEIISLHISRNLKSHAYERLGVDFCRTFESQMLKPAVTLLLNGTIIPDVNSFVLPFRAVNLSAVDVRVVRIFKSNILAFLQENDLSEDSALRRSGRLVYKGTMRLDTDGRDLSKWQDFAIDLGGLLKQESGAIYRVHMSFRQEYSLYGKDKNDRSAGAMQPLMSNTISEEDNAVWDQPYPYYYGDNEFDWGLYNWKDRENPLTPTYYMQSERFPHCNLLSSNLGVIVKSADNGRLWVNINDIMTTEPLEGVNVTAYSYQLQVIGQGTTDAEGSVKMDITGKPFLVVAAKGDIKSYLKVADGYANPLSRFDVGGKKVEKGIKGFVYGERGVWRPGDEIHLTAIIDDPENTIPDSHPATLELYTPEGQFYTTQICSEGKDGFYRFDLQTKEEDPTGRWNAYVKVGGATFHKAIPVETIKPNRLKIKLEVATPIFERGRNADMSLSASWLTGPAAAGLNATAEMTLKAQGGTFKGFDGYIFRDPAAQFSSESYELFNTTLDQEGHAEISAKIPAAPNAPGMLMADIVTRVHEPGGDISTIYQQVPYSPYDAYVGIKTPQTEESYLETDVEHTFRIATVDKNGKRVSGHRIEYQIYKIDWNWWWEYGEYGFDSYVNSSNAKVMTKGSFISGNTDNLVSFKLDYPNWGKFYLHVKDVNSGHVCGKDFMVDWPSWRGRADRGNPDAVTTLTFSTDSKEYKVGQKCTVYIPAASEGRALISIENGSSVISRTWVKTSAEGETPYTFTVSEDMAPNFYIHITLIQPHKNTLNDIPIRMYGIQPVMVNNPSSVLHPTVTMPDVIRPQEEFKVSVGEKDGREMTYTLAIVDEGLLDITGFKTPSPWKHMYAREALGVKTWDIFDNIAGAYSGKFSPALSIGGDEYLSLRGNKQDNRFNPVVKFLGPFTTKGKQTHKITLPMYVGSVRVMVVAGKNGAYGNAEKTVPVRSTLMVLPTLPPVLGTDEKVSVPVNVFAMEDNIKNVEVSISLEGPVKAVSSSQKTLQFQKTGDQIAGFEIRTTGEGVAKVRVKATSAGYSAEDVITVNVRNPHPARYQSEMELLQKGDEVEMEWEKDCQWVKAEASGFPSIDYNGLFAFTQGYSHYCTEQISSRGISLLYSIDRFDENNRKLCGEMVEELLQQLYSRQAADGGFKYWPSMANTDPWCSIMAGHLMTAAIQKGYKVNMVVYNNWKNFMKKSVRSYRDSRSNDQEEMIQCYGLYTLALAGAPENGAMNRLKDSDMSLPQARWMLASAYALSGKKNVAETILFDTAATPAKQSSNNRTFGSHTRDLALALEAYALTGDVTTALELAQEVAEDINLSGYTTQTAAFASVALDALSKSITTEAINIDVYQGSGASKVTSVQPTVALGLDKSFGSARIRNNGEGAVCVKMTSYGRGEQEAESSKLALKVIYKDNNGNTIDPRSLKQGTEFTAEMTVTSLSTTSDYTNLALTARIASGWEIFNDRIYSQEENASGNYTYNDVRDDRSIWYFDLAGGASKSFTMKLCAAYEGEFALPSVSCEAMYDNSVYAYTASEKVTVRK